MTALHSPNLEKLFSYGTLQQENVQIETFGRSLVGYPETILGYRLDSVIIDDPYVVELSGKHIHLMLILSENPQDCVKGTVFDITPDELKRADAYEVSAYKRVLASTQSGEKVWIYAKA